MGDSECVARLSLAVDSLAGRMTPRSPVKAACLMLQYGLMEACRRGEQVEGCGQLSVPGSSSSKFITMISV